MSRQEFESKPLEPRLPLNALEQLNYLPELAERERICKLLFGGIVFLLESHEIIINLERSSFPAKLDERINEKIVRRGIFTQIADIYRLKIVTEYKDRKRIGNLIQSAFPLTPTALANGKPTYRDFSDTKTNQLFREKFNPNISERYTSVHLNIVFPIQNNPILGIGEVQIRNLEEENKFEKTYDSVYRANQTKELEMLKRNPSSI